MHDRSAIPKLCTTDAQCGGSLPYCCTAEEVCVSELSVACYRITPVPRPMCPAGGGPTSGLTATQGTVGQVSTEQSFFDPLQEDNDSVGGIEADHGILLTPDSLSCIGETVVELVNPSFGSASAPANGWAVGVQGYFTGAGAQSYPQAPAGSTTYLDLAVWGEDGSGTWTLLSQEVSSTRNWASFGDGEGTLPYQALWVQTSAY